MSNLEPALADTSSSPWRLAILLAGLAALGLFASVHWLLVVLFFLFMIFMHELGHFLTARWTGMKVVEFFLGFGPRLWSFRRGETTYGIKAIPAGAYVRIIGMNNMDYVAPEDEHRSYRVKSFPRKLLVVSAGSLMHFLMAVVLLFAVVFFYGAPTDDGRWTVAAVSESSAAAAAGVELGDEIVAIDGVEVRSFSHFGDLVTARGGEVVDVAISRGDVVVNEQVTLGSRLSTAGATSISGLFPGDRILAVDGQEVFGWDGFVEALDGRVGVPLAITVDPPNGADAVVVNGAIVSELLPSEVATRGFFGVGPRPYRESVGLFGSAVDAVSEFVAFTRAFVVGMVDLVSGGGLQNFVANTLTGDYGSSAQGVTSGEAGSGLATRSTADENRIISIYGAADLATQIFGESGEGLLRFFALINVSIGLINLLPLPPLDGGHVAVAVYERLRSIGGRNYQVDYAKVLPLVYGVVVVLLLFGLLAVFRDIVDPLNF